MTKMNQGRNRVPWNFSVSDQGSRSVHWSCPDSDWGPAMPWIRTPLWWGIVSQLMIIWPVVCGTICKELKYRNFSNIHTGCYDKPSRDTFRGILRNENWTIISWDTGKIAKIVLDRVMKNKGCLYWRIYGKWPSNSQWNCGSPQRVIGADTLSFNAKVDLVNFWV